MKQEKKFPQPTFAYNFSHITHYIKLTGVRVFLAEPQSRRAVEKNKQKVSASSAAPLDQQCCAVFSHAYMRRQFSIIRNMRTKKRHSGFWEEQSLFTVQEV